MKKKKGFTLVEILAVIIILSVIALVATPIVLDVIEDSRKSAFKSSAYGLYDSARYYYMENELSDTVRFDINNSSVTTTEEKSIIFAGEIKDGTVLINPSGKVALCINDDKYSAYKNYNDTRVTLVEGQSCDIPTGYSIVYVAGQATIREYTNQELTDIVQELQSKIDELENNQKDTTLAGTVIAYMASSTAPEGYLSCDGSVYNISDYPVLAEAIKNGFGSYNYYGGDGVTTFAVPDLRGEFLRGTGTAARDTGSGSNVGEHQDPTQHIFTIKYFNGNLITGSASTLYPLNFEKSFMSTDGKRTDIIGSGTPPVSSNFYTYYTARPTNTSVLYCIKY